MNYREILEEREKTTLRYERSFSVNSLGRERPEAESDMRTVYMRDRDRILHCKSFRRMKHKTQVFLQPEGDHYRTRLTHTLEVQQIARTIARVLSLNEDLVEAIALGHDLGHTPFGHAGERVLNRLCPMGFTHEAQGLRIVSKLENNGRGLNLTYEVRDGIANHSLSSLPVTREGQVVRLADKIAYINHDIDDAIRARILREEDLPKECRKILGGSFRERIDSLVHNVIDYSLETDEVGMSEPFFQAMLELRGALYHLVYIGSEAKEEEKKAERMIEELYEYFRKAPGLLPQASQDEGEDPLEVRVCDHIAAMSDNFAIHTFEQIYVPKAWTIF